MVTNDFYDARFDPYTDEEEHKVSTDIPNQPNEETMRWLVRNACMSADSVAIGFNGTPAAKTRAVVERALEALLANGLIKVVPNEEWRDFYVIDPPYKGFTT